MTFGQPYLLLLLAAIPLLAWLKGRRSDAAAFLYPSADMVRNISGFRRGRAGALLMSLRWLALAAFIIALAQPRLTLSETKVSTSGVDIVIALDMSGSMAAEDFQIRGARVNRLEMAKAVLRSFIEKRPSDRLGLVAFATEAYIASPLTLDHDYLLNNVERLQLGTIDNSRTAIGSGLATALNRLKDLKAKSKIVILMTDGQNNSGDIAPLAAAEAAKALRAKVYTIGVGTKGLAPVPQYFGGRVVGYRSERVDIDEDTLKAIASQTGGTYYRADNAARFLAIYDEIDRLEKTEADVKKYSHYNELFGWALIPGLGLLLLETVLRNTVLRRLP